MTRPRKTHRHLPACVYFKHGSYWYVKAGKWEKLGGDLQSALAAYAAKIEAPKGGMDQLIDAAFAAMKPKLAPATIEQYTIASKKLKTILAEFAPEQVKPKHVAQIKLAMASTPNMANRVLSFLRCVFNYAVEHQLVESNPCVGIRRHDEAKRDRYITDEEYVAIYRAAGPRLQIIMDLCYLTGQRITDVLTIHLRDLIEDSAITFRQKKTGAKLIVKNADLNAVITRAKKLHANVRALTLLHGKTGNVPDYRTVRTQWNEACAAAGVQDAHIHDLRAKSLTDAKRQGKDAQALGGHTDAKMTERYIRLRETPTAEGPSFRQALDVGQNVKQ